MNFFSGKVDGMQAQLESYDPASGKLLGKVDVTGVEEFPSVVARAREAAGVWKSLSPNKRLRIVSHAFAGLEPHMECLAEFIGREMGKDFRQAGDEVSDAVHGAVATARSVHEALQPWSPTPENRIEYAPLGVVGVISPWNYPLAMAANLIVPALVAGNAVVLKPSEETPLVAHEFVDLLNARLPENLLQIVHGGAEQGKALVQSEINMIAFTGSLAAGRDIMARAASGLKRLVMELGGNDPLIVLEDADLEEAARFAVAGSLENSGQMCTSTERIYVHESMADVFERRVTELAEEYEVGPWNGPGVRIGPIINRRQHERIMAHIADAEARGARILLGGAGQKPPYVGPTVVADMTPDMLLEREETFGPVVAVSRYSEVEQAVQRANATHYGLGAVVFGTSGANEVAARLEAGMVGVNQYAGGCAEAGILPWVGAKQSGYGFHGSQDGHRLFAQTRLVSFG